MKTEQKNTNLKVIRTNAEVHDLLKYLEDKDFIAFDTETTGLAMSAEIVGYSVAAEEDRAFYVVLAEWDKEAKVLKYLETKETVKQVLQLLTTKQLIGHNFLFDAIRVENNFKVKIIDALHTDSMILAHVTDENRPVGLKDLGKALFGAGAVSEQADMKASVEANGGTITKANYEMYKADSEILGLYGAKDALLTYQVFLHLVPELYEQGLDKFFYEEESMPLLKGPTYELNSRGMQIDTKGLSSLKKQLEAECLEAKEFIYQEIWPYIKEKYPAKGKKDKFNIGSSSQLSWLVFGQLGLEFGTLTKEGKTVCKALGLKLPYVFSGKKAFIAECLNRVGEIYQPEVKGLTKTTRAKKVKEPWSYIACDKATLTKLAPKYKWIQKLVEYQRKTKLLSTYIEGIEERLEYGTIYPSFLQHGTTSGRYSSRNPNFQNLPRDDQRIKECVTARPGKVFVLADYSQLEPRVFASYSKDPRLMSAFDGSTDFYSVVGMSVYSKFDCTPQKEGSPDAFGVKYKGLRNLAKTIALAVAYGATAHRLAPTTGKSIDDTQEDIDNYLEEFKGVKTMINEAHALAKKQGYVENIFGRKRRIPAAMKIDKVYGRQEHGSLPYEARELLNLAVNHRIQSTGASIINRAAIAFYRAVRDAGLDATITGQVHDEMIIECAEAQADDVCLLLQHCMENTVTLPGVPLEAIPRISKNLAK